MANNTVALFIIEPLGKHHDRSAFDCRPSQNDEESYLSLNSYIQRTARKRQDLDMGRTYVAVQVDQTRVCGYYTLSAAAIDFVEYPDNHNLPKYPIPAILLGKLAVDRTHQGQGLGRDLLIHALKTACEHANGIGAAAVLVEAINEDAERFYRKYGFASLNKPGRHLYLTMKAVRLLP